MLDSSSDEESQLVDREQLTDEEDSEVIKLTINAPYGGSNSGLSSRAGSLRSSSTSIYTRPHSTSPSIQSEQGDDEDEERKERLQLYVFVLRCIAYPFNAKQPTDMVRRQSKVTKAILNAVKERFSAFLKGETKLVTDEAFHNAVKSYFETFLCCDRVVKMVASGAYSANDFREVFKSNIERRVRNLPEINGLSKETVLSSWMAKFDAIYRGEDDPRKQTQRLATTGASELILSKEQLYEMFQTILGVKKYEHQILFNACQLDNADEQAACIRRELQERMKNISKARKKLPPFIHKDMEAMFPDEEQRIINQLMANLESLPITKGSSDSKYSLHRLKKAQNSISMIDVAEDAEPTLCKSDVVLSFTLEVVVAEARGLNFLSPQKIVYCTMEVEGSEKLRTDDAEAGNPNWDTEGDFTTTHPLPVVKVKLYAENTGVLALDDKEIGKVVVHPTPGCPEGFEWYNMVSPRGDKDKVELKMAIRMDKPTTLKKCGYVYSHGKTVWRKWKKRFLILVQVSQYTFALCGYHEKKSEPHEMMQMDGYTVDYTDPMEDEEYQGGKYFFKAVKEGDLVIFATDEELDRHIWVHKLYMATGQSYKPVAPKLMSPAMAMPGATDSLRRLIGDTDRARKAGLDDLIQASPCDFNHPKLFEKMQELTLNHRLNDSFSCLGWFSPGQVFVLDEYCQRYGVRGCHRQLHYLRNLLDKMDAGYMIDPALLHYSYAFCSSHVHGNKPDGIETITVEEKYACEVIKERLWNVLSYQIVHFRYSFPFGRPEGALKASLSLFERVMMKDISSPVPPEEFGREIQKCLQQAALINYTRLSAYAGVEDSATPDTPFDKRLEDIMTLAELCIDLLQQNDEYHGEALAWFSKFVAEHCELFWSMFAVDMDACLSSQPADTWDSFSLFQFLNDYLREDATLQGGSFHQHLMEQFAPQVIRYIDLMESSVAQSVHVNFAKESWEPLGEGCAASEDLFWKLMALQQFVTDLHWPQQDFADHLIHRLQLMASDMVESCVNRTKAAFARAIKGGISFEYILPSTVCVMINTVVQAFEQSYSLCTKDDSLNPEYQYHSDIEEFVRDAKKDILEDTIAKLNSVLDSFLNKLSRYDQGTILSSILSLKNSDSSAATSYVTFVSENLRNISSKVYNCKFRKKLFKDWYLSIMSKIRDWLTERLTLSLHQHQLTSLNILIEMIPKDFEEYGLTKRQLNNNVFNMVRSRLEVEEASKKGTVLMAEDKRGYRYYDADDEDDSDEDDD